MACRIYCVLILFGFSIISRTKGQCESSIQSVTSPSSRQLKVTWWCNDGGTTSLSRREYQVNYQLTHIGQCQPVTQKSVGDGFSRLVPGTNVQGSATFYEFSAILSNLRPYSSYLVSVTTRIVNAETGVTSLFHNVRTDEEVPTVGPQVNVDENLITTSSIYVSWNEIPCESRGSPILGYGFQLFDESNVKVADGTTHPYDPNTLSVTILELQPDKIYTLSVYATNIIGPGPSTVMDIRTLATGPDSPALVRLQVAYKTSLKFEWDAASCGSYTPCSSIANYVYKLTEVNKEVIHERGTAETYVTITNLAPCTTYEFSVAATSNTEMTGPQSEPPVIATTAVDVPLPISSIETMVYVDDPSMLMVTWEAPSGPCLANSYSVTYRLDNRGMCGDGPKQSLTIPDVSGTSVQIDNLLPYSSYSIFIISKNDAGSGMDMSGSASTLELAPSAPPSDIRKTDTTANSVTFMWSEVPCVNRNGVITEYHYMIVDESANSQRVGTVTTTSVTIGDLQPCLNYVFSVAAATAVGMGPYSAGVQYETNEVVPHQIRSIEAHTSFENPSNVIVTWQEPDGPCPADSYTVKYSLDNQGMCEFVTSQNITLSAGTSTQVEIKNTIPYSIYSIFITATNGAGSGIEKKEIITTEEAEPTVSPSKLQRTGTTAYSVTFTWTELTCEYQNGVISGYHYKLVGESANSQSEDTITATTVTIGELQPCSNYKLSVAAATSAGRGPYSEEVSFVTDEVAPSPVSEITAEPHDQREGGTISLLVNWRPPSAGQGECAADWYFAQYELVNGDMCNANTQISTIMNKTEINTSTTLMDLMPYSSYEMFVQAGNEAGRSTAITIMKNTGEKQPTGPPIDVNIDQSSSTSIRFTWQEPACGDRNGQVTMYLCSLTNGTDINMEQTTPGNNIEYDGLVPYTEYSFRVKARTSAGFGPFSMPLVITTDDDNPPAPKNVRQVNANITSITFAWSPPDPPHGEIIGYVLEYTKPEERPMRVSLNETSYTLGGLIANDEVLFRVRAETSKGLGPWSKLVTSVAQEGVPSMPAGLKSVGTGRTSIVLQWRTPIHQNGVIIEYTIKYQALHKPYDPNFKPTGIYSTVTSTVPLTDDDAYTQLIDELQPSTKYEFRVSGRTSVGTGEEAVFETYTKVIDVREPEPPKWKTAGASVILELGELPIFVSNVLVSEEFVGGARRRKRQGDSLDRYSFIVANLTRSNIDDGMMFTVGDNKTYGGYVNHPLIAGLTYTVRVAHASCTSEECIVEWSKLSIITVPDCTKVSCYGLNLGGLVGGGAGGIVGIGIVILLITVCVRHYKSSKQGATAEHEVNDEGATAEHEVYDEINETLAKQSVSAKDTRVHNTGYEVNLAMGGISTAARAPSTGTDYEDVNIKGESEYQGLNTGEMGEEHEYQGLGDRKTSSPYVNVS